MIRPTLAGEVRWFLDAWQMPVKMIIDRIDPKTMTAIDITERQSFAVVPVVSLRRTLAEVLS
jgi:hypothetical protein